MENTGSAKKFENLITVIAGGLLLGLLWRVRGTSGWGSSWGLLNAGFIFTLFVILVKGTRQKMDFGWTALTALSFMLTVPGWGTIITQITGLLPKTLPDGSTEYVSISVFSAVFLMLCLGFGLAVLFGIMLGRGLSGKQWRLKDFLLVLAVFYITDLIAKASLSHIILNTIQPQSSRIFEEALTLQGMDISAWKAFLTHFNDISWAKKIDGGRNYFASVQAVSALIRSISVLLAVRFIVKDRTSAKTGFAVSSAFAFAITAADLFFYFGMGGYHMENTPLFGKFIVPWPSWEYFTGFIAGIIITAFIVKLRPADDVPELAFSHIPDRPKRILTFLTVYVFLIGVNFVRPVLDRMEDNSCQLLFTALAAVCAVVLVAHLVKKFGCYTEKASSEKIASVIFPVFLVYIFFIYMFTGASRDEINCFNILTLHNLAVTVSFALVLAWSLIKAGKIKNKNIKA